MPSLQARDHPHMEHLIRVMAQRQLLRTHLEESSEGTL